MRGPDCSGPALANNQELTASNIVSMRRAGQKVKTEDHCPPGNRGTHGDLIPCSTDHLLAAHRGRGCTFSLINCQMMRVISSPSISTTGFSTLILLSASRNRHRAHHPRIHQWPNNRSRSYFQDQHSQVENGHIEVTHHTQLKGLGPAQPAWPARSSSLGS